jgi:hypothetical protein
MTEPVVKYGPTIQVSQEFILDGATYLAGMIAATGHTPFERGERTPSAWLSLLQWQHEEILRDAVRVVAERVRNYGGDPAA